MITLINNIIAFLETAITAGDVSAKGVTKGLHSDPQQIGFSDYPYIAIDDGGERQERNESQESTTHFYSVIIEMGFFETSRPDALDGILTLSNEVKKQIELEANKQLDGLVWGINITPFQWDDQSGFFYGRTVTIDYFEYEFNYID